MSLAPITSCVLNVGTVFPVHTSRRCIRDPRSLTVVNAGDACRDRTAAALGALELPHGVLWWQNKQHSVYKHDVLHGQDFTLQRQRSGGPGLVLSNRLSDVQLVEKTERERVQIAMYKSANEEKGVQLVLSDMFTFDLTDYSLFEESEPADDAHHTSFPPTACTGIVLHSDGQQQQQQAGDQVLTSHSRRTKAVRYTCKRCGTITTKAVNPHAWATGTVFGRCDGCQVIHKLTDNLELFHELSGPLVNSPINPDRIIIPESLPQNPYMP